MSTVAACLVLAAGCKLDLGNAKAAAAQDVPAVTDSQVPKSDTSGTANTSPTPAPVAPASPAPIQTITPLTSLPALPAMTNLRVLVNGGSATITFDSVDNARDYRVYALPPNDNIQQSSDGTVIVPNAVYRCAGTYQVPKVQVEDEQIQSHGITARVTSAVNGYTRSLGEATLGYVYTTPDAAPGLIPVYAVGNPVINADNDYFYRYQASRDKKYTSSASEYATLVNSGWRDDGIAFYVPSQASAATKPVLSNATLDDPVYGARYYLLQGAELNSRNQSLGFSTAFNVLTTAAAGTRPLMRVFYTAFGGHSHDELAVGTADFVRLRYQGLDNPVTTLHYSGLTASTTLVVEALDSGCPFQGNLTSQSVAAQTFDFQTFKVSHQPWQTIADLQKVVPNGEVFVNGQFDGVSGKPKAIARAYLNVEPRAREQMDWVSTPASFSENFSTLACQAPDGNCFQQFHLQSSTYDISFFYTETNHWTVGNVMGQFLLNYADWAADTNGKFRMTVRNHKATIGSSTFAHATMEVNSVGSGRRYPQLILSDQDIPVQYNLVNGRSLILQTFGDFPSRVDLEICDHVTWDVNMQCPRFIFRHRFNGSGAVTGINPIPEEDQFMAAMDVPTRFDLYASSSKAYVFVNGKPYACANLTGTSGISPAPVAPTGPVTVTFGDALYHSGVDENFVVKMAGGFVQRHQLYSASRHFDNLGIAGGVVAPAWDEAKIPCSSIMTDLGYDPNP